MSNTKRIEIRVLGIVAATTLLVMDCASAQSTERQQRDLELSQSMEIVTNIMRELESGYVDDINAPELLEAAAAGLILVTDPYSDYYSEKEMSDFEMMTTGRYAGVGSLIRKQETMCSLLSPTRALLRTRPASRLAIRFSASAVRI